MPAPLLTNERPAEAMRDARSGSGRGYLIRTHRVDPPARFPREKGDAEAGASATMSGSGVPKRTVVDVSAADVSPDAPALAEIGDSLVVAWRAIGVQAATGPRPGSRAALDAAEISRELPAGINALGHAPGQFAGRMVEAIALLLQSIGTQLRAEPLIPLAVWPLVRAELEHAGRVAWLLEPFTGENAASRRAARALLEHASSLQREKYTAGKHSRSMEKAFKRHRDGLLDRVKTVFADVHTPLEKIEQVGEWRIGGEEMLGLGKAIDLFVALNFDKGSGIYDVLSDRSHPSVTSLALQSTSQEVDGVLSWTYPVDPAVLDFQVRLGCLVLYKSAYALASYYGLDASPLERWADSVPAHWFREEPATS